MPVATSKRQRASSGKWERAAITEKQARIWDYVRDTPPGGMCLIGYGGAAGGGKTRAIVELAIDRLTDSPGNKVLIGRRDYSDLRSTTMEQFDMHCPPAYVVGKNDSEHWRDLRLDGWPEGITSRVVFRELKDYYGLGSEEYGDIFIDEAGEVPKKSALMLLSRLRWTLPEIVTTTPRTKETPWGRTTPKYPGGAPLKHIFFAASNPWPGTWFEDWFIKRLVDESALATFGGAVFFIPALPKDNPHLPENYAERLRLIYPEDWIKRMLEGRWDAFEGQVYPQFNENLHCYRGTLPDQKEWKRIIGGLDFGGQNPYDHMSAGIVAIELKSNRIIRVAEFESRGNGVYDRQVSWMLAQEMKWCTKQTGPRIHWVADKTQGVAIHQWKLMNFRVKPSAGTRNSVDFGIAQVARRLDPDASGIPGSFFMPQLTTFPERMKAYRYEEPNGDKASARPDPLKKDDDLLDADRYMHELLETTYGPPDSLIKNQIPVTVTTGYTGGFSGRPLRTPSLPVSR